MSFGQNTTNLIVYVSIPGKTLIKNKTKLINILYRRKSKFVRLYCYFIHYFFILVRKIGSSDFPELRESLLDLSNSANFFKFIIH